MSQLQTVMNVLAESSHFHPDKEEAMEIVKQMMQAEPVAYESRMYPEKTTARNTWSPCTKEQHDMYIRSPEFQGWIYEARALFAAPQALSTLTPISKADRMAIFSDAELAMRRNPELSWRDAIVDQFEAVYGIK